MVTIIPHSMNIAILPTVQEVSGTVTVVASQPVSLLKKKSAAGDGSARRAFATLGSNNSHFNMNMVKSQITMGQEEFTNTWNFNPVKEVPLAPGRYRWAPLGGCNDTKITPALSGVAKDIKLLKDITNPTITKKSPPSVTSEVTNLLKFKQDDQENNGTVPTSIIKNENIDYEDTSDSENRKQGQSPSCETVLVSKKSVLSRSQICITEFFRPQKRKSSYQCEDSQPNTPAKKKLRLV